MNETTSLSNSLDHDANTAWTQFIQSHPLGTAYHLPGWNKVIQNAYGHKIWHLSICNSQSPQSAARLAGGLTLVHMNHFLFGNKLVSLPYLDSSGILADDDLSESKLIDAAVSLGRDLGVDVIELRQSHPLDTLSVTAAGEALPSPAAQTAQQDSGACMPERTGHRSSRSIQHPGPKVHHFAQKVRMVLDLPDTPSQLMGSFKSKLRSQIRKPIKEGCAAKIGGRELLDDFYRVFLTNMRDLGSPVHSMVLMKELLDAFPEQTRVVVVYRNATPLASSILIGFNKTLQNPWASSLKEYRAMNPNMLLYWTMLEYACENGFKMFDFGRSTPGEGTHRFKEQWGARPVPLHWYTISLNEKETLQPATDKSRFDKAIACWQKMPVPLTRCLGPLIRRHIAL